MALASPFPAGRIYCGTSGWSYPHWNGFVYPKARQRGFHALDVIASSFDAVEINTTFYQPLRPEVARLWLMKVAVNPRFLFTAKLERRFTHDRTLDAAGVARFKEGLRPLARAGRLGCVLMQFPWTFRFTAENRQWLIALRRAFHEFPLVAEMRHNSWMSEEALGVLMDHRVGFCNIDQPASPEAMPPAAFLTSSIAYVRLHGRGSGKPGARPHEYLYQLSELAEWKARIAKLARSAASVFVFTNNDGAGKSFVNALQLQRMFEADRNVAPPLLLAAYGDALTGFEHAAGGQPSLFIPPDSGVGPRRAA